MENVAQLQDLRRLVLSDEDRAAVHNAGMYLKGSHADLGAEVERHEVEVQRLKEALAREEQRHEAAKRELLREIQDQRTHYGALVGLLAKRYVKGPGRFDFNPDLGAFVETKE